MRAMPERLSRGPERAAEPPGEPPGPTAGRWDDRPVLAGAIRALSSLLPLLASTAVAWLLAQALPAPHSTGGRALWWFGVASASLLALVAFDRVARRLLPLAALLKLSMVFPDRAPSRLGVALRSGSTRRLQERALHDLEEGKQEPAAAASTIIMLAASLSAHDRGTRGHSERVRAYADLIAEELGLGRSERDRLRWAALLHDLGKLSVPASTLNAHDALTDGDWATLRRHPLEGARLAAPLRGWLGTWATAIEQHHERYDGTGYPYGLAGEQLSLAARIVAVADSYDAMTSVRSYSPGMAPAAARRELARKAGTHFDPAVVRAFLNVGLGRVRWVMGPLAFLSILPFAPRAQRPPPRCGGRRPHRCPRHRLAGRRHGGRRAAARHRAATAAAGALRAGGTTRGTGYAGTRPERGCPEPADGRRRSARSPPGAARGTGGARSGPARGQQERGVAGTARGAAPGQGRAAAGRAGARAGRGSGGTRRRTSPAGISREGPPAGMSEAGQAGHAGRAGQPGWRRTEVPAEVGPHGRAPTQGRREGRSRPASTLKPARPV